MDTSERECSTHADFSASQTESSIQWCKDVTHVKLSLSSCLKSKQFLELGDSFEITKLIPGHADDLKKKPGFVYCLKWTSADEEWECPLENAFSLFLAKGVSDDNHCFIIKLGSLIVSFDATRATALVDHSTEHGCGQIMKDFWKTLKLADRSLLYEVINSIDSSVAENETDNERLAFMLLSCSRFVLLCCGLSSKFCAEFLKADGQKSIIRDLNFKEFEPRFVSNICSAKEFVLNCLRTVRCLCRVAAETNQLNLFFDDQLKAVERIMLFLKSADRDVRLAAFYALVFLASESGENDKSIVLHEIDVLFELFQLFKAAVDDALQLIDRDARSRSMKTVSHHRVSVVLKQWLPSFPSRSRSPAKSNENSDIETSKVLTFKDVGQIQEYLEVLHLAMSFDDDIGSMLFDGIGLDKFKDIIMEHDRWPGSVVVESLACLWQLCFIPRALEQMKTENDLLAHIQRLQCECRSDMCTANEIKEIKEKAAGLMFKLKQMEVRRFLRQSSSNKMRSSPQSSNSSVPVRQRSWQSVKMDMQTTVSPKIKESLRRSRGPSKQRMKRMQTEPLIPTTVSALPSQPKFASLNSSLATTSSDLKLKKKTRTVISTAQPKEIQNVQQMKSEKAASAHKALLTSFADKNIETFSEASAASEKSLASFASNEGENVTIIRTPMKSEQSTIEYARAPESMPPMQLTSPVPGYMALDVEEVSLGEAVPEESDNVDSLLKETVQEELDDALAILSIEGEKVENKLPVEEIVIEKEVTEYRIERPYTVMLSYSWNNQEQMKSIRDALKGAGFDVWMDIDNLARGSILMNMAEAVESCDVFVYGVSPAYHKSQACRTEAEYAYTIRKEMIPVKLVSSFEPSGWLGILVGNDLYFDISTPEKAVEQIPKLVNAVRVTLNMSRLESTSSSDPETPLKPIAEYSTSFENPDFADSAGNGLLTKQVNFDLVRDRLVRLLHGTHMPPNEIFSGWNSGNILSDDAILIFRRLNRASPDEVLKIAWQAVQNKDEMRKFFLCLELMGALESHFVNDLNDGS